MKRPLKTIIIKSLSNGSCDIISNVPDNVPSHRIVEDWQKNTIYYKVRKRLPGVKWKVAKSNDILKAMIESAKI